MRESCEISTTNKNKLNKMDRTAEVEIEDLELQLEEKLLELDTDELSQMAIRLTINETNVAGKRKTQIIKLIRKYIEDILDKEDDSEIKKALIEIVLIANSVKIKKPSSADNGDEKEKLDIAAATTLSSDDATPMLTRKLSNLEEKLDSLTMNKKKSSLLTTWRKDFVISGKVGEPTNEKDIGYLGTVRQMKEGLDKGYDDAEVVAAVLKAIGPRSLKTYLGMIDDLRCEDLCRYLRIHYHEKSATELYQELINMKQTSKETPIAFVVRAFETREKILIASREGGREAYDERQVRQLCKSTIETGIDENISLIIRPLLSKNISDVELMSEISKAEALLQLRQQKSGDRKNVKINMIVEKEEENEILKAIKNLETKMSSVDDLKREFRELKSQVGEMQKKTSSEENRYRNNTEESQRKPARHSGVEQRQYTNASEEPRYSERKCSACQNANADICQHCYRCGSSEHYANFPGCRGGSGNYRGLSRGGRR